MEIFKEMKKLNLPSDKYVVVGSGIMAALGIKKANDIDLVVTKDLFKVLSEQDWQKIKRPNGEPGLEKGKVAAYLDVNCGNFNPTTEELIKDAEIIHDIPFISLRTLVKFKEEYGREKDKKDIDLINKYLESTK